MTIQATSTILEDSNLSLPRRTFQNNMRIRRLRNSLNSPHNKPQILMQKWRHSIAARHIISILRATISYPPETFSSQHTALNTNKNLPPLSKPPLSLPLSARRTPIFRWREGSLTVRLLLGKHRLLRLLQRVYSNLGYDSSSSNSSSSSYDCNNLQKLKYYIQESDDDFEEEDGTVELVQIGAERAKNVLILMSDTGGGHRASAEAIRDAFKLEYGDEYRIIVKDVWKEYTGWPLNDMERQYKFMVKHVQLWKVAFHSTSPRWIHSCYLAAIAAYYAKEVEAGLMEYKPDIIISVHPMMQHIPLWVLKWQGLQKKVIFVTVITDLNSCHPTWFHPGVNRCYCPSTEVAKRAALDGLEDSQIRVFGLPIRPSFARAVLSKDELREELELDPSLPAVLLMGGGEGMGPVKKTALALGESLFDKELGKPLGQLIIICGRNKVLKSTLESHEWTIPVKVRGFETQMEKWMGACDCIITKAGPGTIAEALIRGLPIILNDYIPGQEKGNVPYVVDNGAGVFTRSPKETAKIVTEWFCTKTDERERMSENALKVAQPEAPNLINETFIVQCAPSAMTKVVILSGHFLGGVSGLSKLFFTQRIEAGDSFMVLNRPTATLIKLRQRTPVRLEFSGILLFD
ncbi:MONOGALACTOSYLDIACYLGLYCEROL SYNTHASE 3 CHLOROPLASTIC [Salix viminalis]|uniref:monogalactosyldiacylglycerol synthase n=1 Tax=Salix viminalis TaxID=40686 RepID=A0A9Q0ZPD9_SALVM|nr:MONOGALACTOSYLDIACYLGLYCEROL SYNTHASE 3 CHLOROPLASTIC [Salix viminalis]